MKIVSPKQLSYKPRHWHWPLGLGLFTVFAFVGTAGFVFWQSISIVHTDVTAKVKNHESKINITFQDNDKFSGYYRDNTYIYYGEDIVEGVDRETFVLLTCIDVPGGDCDKSTAKDKNHVYVEGKIWPGADPNTIVVVYEGFLKDKNHVYDLSDFNGNDSCPGCMNVDVASFTSLGAYYFQDKDHIYWGHIVLPVDTKTFFVWGDSGFAKDSQHVYRYGRIFENADPNTFFVFEGYQGWYAKDINHVYIRGSIVEDLDPKTFSVIDQNYSKDAFTVWLTLQFDPAGALPESDPNTFVLLSTQGGQAGTFAPIDSDYSKDATHVYFLDSLVSGADPNTITVLNSRYAKDVSHVFSMERVIPEADVASIEVFPENAWFAKDKDHVFTKEKIITGADPKTFILKEGYTASGVWYNAEDKNHKYSYEKIVQ